MRPPTRLGQNLSISRQLDGDNENPTPFLLNYEKSDPGESIFYKITLGYRRLHPLFTYFSLVNKYRVVVVGCQMTIFENKINKIKQDNFRQFRNVRSKF